MQEKGKHMQPVLEPEPHHHVLHHKMKDSYAPIYLTVLSVIQGVALADLASVVAAGYRQFTVVDWLLVVLTFGSLISLWNQYTMQSAILNWVPDIRDAAIPFVFGALELFLNHSIILSLSAWLFATALISSVGALATWYARWRAGKEAENAKMLSLIRRRLRVLILYTLGLSVLLLLLALVSRVGSLEASDGVQGMHGVLALGIVLLVAGSEGGFLLLSMQHWGRVVDYARTGQMPGMHVEDLAS